MHLAKKKENEKEKEYNNSFEVFSKFFLVGIKPH